MTRSYMQRCQEETAFARAHARVGKGRGHFQIAHMGGGPPHGAEPQHTAAPAQWRRRVGKGDTGATGSMGLAMALPPASVLACAAPTHCPGTPGTRARAEPSAQAGRTVKPAHFCRPGRPQPKNWRPWVRWTVTGRVRRRLDWRQRLCAAKPGAAVSAFAAVEQGILPLPLLVACRPVRAMTSPTGLFLQRVQHDSCGLALVTPRVPSSPFPSRTKKHVYCTGGAAVSARGGGRPRQNLLNLGKLPPAMWSCTGRVFWKRQPGSRSGGPVPPHSTPRASGTPIPCAAVAEEGPRLGPHSAVGHRRRRDPCPALGCAAWQPDRPASPAAMRTHSLLQRGQALRVLSHRWMQSKWKTWPQAPHAMLRPGWSGSPAGCAGLGSGARRRARRPAQAAHTPFPGSQCTARRLACAGRAPVDAARPSAPVGFAWYSMLGSYRLFRQMAQVSVQMAQDHLHEGKALWALSCGAGRRGDPPARWPVRTPPYPTEPTLRRRSTS